MHVSRTRPTRVARSWPRPSPHTRRIHAVHTARTPYARRTHAVHTARTRRARATQAAAKAPGGLDGLLLTRVGPFAASYERLALKHLASGSEQAALIAAERSQDVLPAWGRPFGFHARMLQGLGREEEVGMPVWVCVRGHACVGMRAWVCVRGHACVGM